MDVALLHRLWERRKEFELSLNLIQQAIEKKGPVRADMPNPLKFCVPAGEVYVKVEAARGEHGFNIVSDGETKPYRMAVRRGSYTVTPVYAKKALVWMRIEDVALWMGTMDICAPDFVDSGGIRCTIRKKHICAAFIFEIPAPSGIVENPWQSDGSGATP